MKDILFTCFAHASAPAPLPLSLFVFLLKRCIFTNGEQPFYSLLVDTADAPPAAGVPPVVAYCAEELLLPLDAPESNSDAAAAPPPPGGQSLADARDRRSRAFDHPYLYILFLGTDHRGDYVPTRALRARCGADRRDVYAEGDDGSTDPPGSEPDEDRGPRLGGGRPPQEGPPGGDEDGGGGIGFLGFHL